MDIENRLKRLEWTNRLLLFVLSITAITLWYTAGSHVNAAQNSGAIVASSIETRSISVSNPTGKQGVRIEAGDDGMVSIGMTNVDGKQTISLLSDPTGKPSVCLAYGNVCRVVIGDVYRANRRELSLQLRDAAGKSVWIPATSNPLASSGGDSTSR